MSFVKTGSVAVLREAPWGSKFIAVRVCICEESAVECMHILEVSTCELRENRFTESRTVLKRVQEICFVHSAFFVRLG